MTLEILTADSLSGLRHGFFTRRGGVSSGIFAGLNCGPGSSDQSHAVATNRGRVAEAMGVAPDMLLSLNQVHSADVVTIDGAGWAGRPRADATVTRHPGLALGILTADCAPVLFADAGAGVIGAAHAGWRGTLGGIIEATVGAMEAAGARRGAIRAGIGPAISQREYEVGPDFFGEAAAEGRRIQLSWISPLTSTYLFVDESGTKTEMRGLKDLARAMLSGRARVIADPEDSNASTSPQDSASRKD